MESDRGLGGWPAAGRRWAQRSRQRLGRGGRVLRADADGCRSPRRRTAPSRPRRAVGVLAADVGRRRARRRTVRRVVRPQRQAQARLRRASPGTIRDRLAGELLLARAAIESGEDAGEHVTVAVRARGPRAPGPGLPGRRPGGDPAGPGGRGIARDRVRHQPVGGAGFPSPLPRHTPPADGDADRAGAAGAAVLALAPHQRRDRPRMPDVGEHGQGAPEEHLRQARGLHPRRRRSSGPACSACSDRPPAAPSGSCSRCRCSPISRFVGTGLRVLLGAVQRGRERRSQTGDDAGQAARSTPQ